MRTIGRPIRTGLAVLAVAAGPGANSRLVIDIAHHW
jgi:hypothetical protein